MSGAGTPPARRRSVALLAVLLTAGCSVGPDEVGVTANCEGDGGRVNPLLVLMAQAVPSAELVPCVRAVPSSWRRGDVDVRDGRGLFAFESSVAEGPGDAVLSVVLSERCDVGDATEVPSDEPGTQRFERLRDVARGYEGERFYVYDGGCTTLQFRVHGQDSAQQVGAASLAIGFLSRDDLREGVRERSDGRLRLDDVEGAP